MDGAYSWSIDDASYDDEIGILHGRMLTCGVDIVMESDSDRVWQMQIPVMALVLDDGQHVRGEAYRPYV